MIYWIVFVFSKILKIENKKLTIFIGQSEFLSYVHLQAGSIHKESCQCSQARSIHQESCQYSQMMN